MLDWKNTVKMALLHKAIYRFSTASASAAKSLESCPTLCDPIDGSPLGSAIPGILQARVLEWGATAYQITNGIFHRIRTKIFTVCMEIQNTPHSQSNLEKEKQLRE